MACGQRYSVFGDQIHLSDRFLTLFCRYHCTEGL